MKNSAMKKLLLLFIISTTNLVGFTQTSGGSDFIGYTWFDSDDPSGPRYNWIDITTNGTLVTGLTDDNSAGVFSIPSFVYYGTPCNQIKIGSNGWISFDNVSNIASYFPTIPQLGGPANNYISPYMTDLIFSGTSTPGQVYYYDDSVNNRFIIST